MQTCEGWGDVSTIPLGWVQDLKTYSGEDLNDTVPATMTETAFDKADPAMPGFPS